jgi:hypothetical protein
LRTKLTHFAPLLAVGAFAAAGIVTATSAAAAPMPSPRICVQSGTGIGCQSPRNVKITDSAPDVDFRPYGAMPYLLSGH